MKSSKKTGAEGIKRLYIDIEVSPNLAFIWRPGREISVNHDAIVSERKIICAAWKWSGESRVHTARWDSDQDDRKLLAAVIKEMNQADEIVGHFIDKFDLPWIRTRAMIQRMGPLPRYKTVDTKALACRDYYFNSAKLDYLGGILGYGHKHDTSFSMWKDIVLRKCPVAMEKMVRYCARDVELLERVHLEFIPQVKPATHVGVLNGGPRWSCPITGSLDVIKSKKRVTAAGSIQHQMMNVKTGTYFTISDAVFKEYLERNKKKK